MVGIIDRSPSQNNFLEILNQKFPFIVTDVKETYILGDFNINIYESNKYIVHENNTVCTKFAFAHAKKYHQFCTMHGFKQLIQCPTRVTCSTSTLVDHILASSPSRVSQKGVINVSLSDHQFIFCTRKVSKCKTGGVLQYINFRSLKNYRADDHKKSLGQVVFPNYEIFDDVNAVCSDFFQKIMTVIDKITRFKTKQVKGNTQKWFDREVLEKLNSRDKHFLKFKKSRLHIDKELFKKAKYDALKLIATKNRLLLKKKSRKVLVNQKNYGNPLNI